MAVVGPHYKQFLNIVAKLEELVGHRYEFVWVDHEATHPFKGRFSQAFIQIRFVRHYCDHKAQLHSDKIHRVAGAGTSGLINAMIGALDT